MPMPPPAKEQEVEKALPPIVFEQPGMKCDTRIHVFQQEFQVHSIILKLRSAFFRKFLDSPEKGDISAQCGWQYNWISEIDNNSGSDDAGWHLVSTKDYTASTFKPQSKNLLQKSHLDSRRQVLFHTLLCAFYVLPYVIESLEELEQLTILADYYCSLPIVSRTLNAAMLANSNHGEWYREIDGESSDVLLLATKLRNALLFKDALILHVSHWTSPYPGVCVDNPKLKKIAENAYNGIALLISKYYIRSHEDGKEVRGAYRAFAKAAKDEFGRLKMPMYFKSIYDDPGTVDSCVRGVIRSLLTSNLAFPNDDHVAGVEDCERRFLCAWMDDEDLPWDRDEVDW